MTFGAPCHSKAVAPLPVIQRCGSAAPYESLPPLCHCEGATRPRQSPATQSDRSSVGYFAALSMTVKEILSVVPLPQNDIWCSLSFKGGRPSSCHSEVRLCRAVGIPSAPPSLRGSNATAAIPCNAVRSLAMTKRSAHILTGTFYFKNSALSIVFLKKRQISIFPYPFYIKNYIKLIHSHKRTLPKAKNTKKAKAPTILLVLPLNGASGRT